MDDEGRDPIELLEAGTRLNRTDDDDRSRFFYIHHLQLAVILLSLLYYYIIAVCANDGHTYPSTCHMIVESRTESIPHVMHPGGCSNRTDGPSRMVRPPNC